MWINPQTEQVFTLHSEIRAAFPSFSFPSEMSEDDIAFAGLLPVVPTVPTAHDPATHQAVPVAPVLEGGVWLQQWEVTPLPPPTVPAVVTMRQARLALLGAGLLDGVEAAIDAMSSPQKDAARIEWEYSQEVQRHNGFVSVLAPMLGLTEAQTDALFVVAAGL